MKCPKCVAEGLTSHVRPGVSTGTAMYCPPFYDEAGVYHSHNRNRGRQDFRCSHGHAWSEDIVNRCPAPGCGWTSGHRETGRGG